MNIQTFNLNADEARNKWREYKEAAKQKRDPLYTQLRDVYNQIKNGKSVIQVSKAIRDAGINAATGHPKLAIAPANEKLCHCKYLSEGHVFYSARNHWSRAWSGNPGAREFQIDGCFPKIRQPLFLTAPIPIIPPRLRPLNLTDDYYILWEVDHWTIQPSRDPYLLKKITKDMMVVCAAWDLTDVEMAVLGNSMH